MDRKIKNKNYFVIKSFFLSESIILNFYYFRVKLFFVYFYRFGFMFNIIKMLVLKRKKNTFYLYIFRIFEHFIVIIEPIFVNLVLRGSLIIFYTYKHVFNLVNVFLWKTSVKEWMFVKYLITSTLLWHAVEHRIAHRLKGREIASH
jgi:hypothetical protein